ncbi:MAG: hypothetical protein GYA51_10170 [Candidatus Methanofastidiosa archaeon]|nr:hypothetical protein [Candidatus Methanofastidiosa archaeon]
MNGLQFMGNMKIQDLLNNEGKFIFDVNDWGSCQYSGALAMFNSYFELRKTYARHYGPYVNSNERHKLAEKSENQISILDYFRSAYGYDIRFTGIRDDENAIDMYFKIEANRWHWNFDLWNAYNSSQYDELRDFEKQIIKSIRRAQSADDLFFVGRFAASDLWHTAPKVAESYFVGFEAKGFPNCDKPLGIERGPIGNICAQSDNVLTGLCCALLVDYDIVKNINSFKGFDT